MDTAARPVATPDEIREALTEEIRGLPPGYGLLLSGGIDSAILAALMPRGTRCYTIKYDTGDAIDEAGRAREIASRWGLDHQVVTVTWEHYEDNVGPLFDYGMSPLHPLGPALRTAAMAAVSDGLVGLIAGTGADVIFGGMDRLLSSSWKFDEFVRRYTFCEPTRVLSQAQQVREPFDEFHLEGERIDVHHFLQHVHGIGIADAFQNALKSANCEFAAPYESMSMADALDVDRVINGQPKYLLQQVYRGLYEDEPPTKIAFSRPMNRWFESWGGPVRPEFRADLDIAEFDGESRWLIWCLERFMSHFDSDEMCSS